MASLSLQHQITISHPVSEWSFSQLNHAFRRTGKMQAHKEGKKRSLVIRKCEVDESARITARTNVDETGTVFMVKCKYRMEEDIFSLFRMVQ